ncbi:hypothetical protein M413DRAFT_26674 [Hebeloma cylindrosporum]|uniref:F-box domain-containing protein n=1 Tax=Hebeloma cylindrosporum TaxID=76867 RepID=A0A0C3CGD4_HEBCY|nr:hypothetical protein M413DRAFT_26674 [Hebeloma cylindrosporum h7]
MSSNSASLVSLPPETRSSETPNVFTTPSSSITHASPLTRVFRQRLCRHPPILVPGPINRIPLEVLSNVFILASDFIPMCSGITTSSTYFPLVLCHVSFTWRQVALATAPLWQTLSADIYLYGAGDEGLSGTRELDKLMVEEQTINFLTWWAANVRNNNTFALRFKVIWDIYSKTSKALRDTNIVLGMTGLSTIRGLVSRARYLHLQLQLEQDALPLTDLERRDDSGASIASIIFPSTEGLVLPTESLIFDGDDFRNVPLNVMPALRKLRLRAPGVRLGPRAPRPVPLRPRLENIWGQLTHVAVGISLTMREWKRFIRTCITLESGRITLGIDSLHDSNPRSGTRTLPNLRELCLVMTDPWPYEGRPESNIFQGLYCPRLETLLLYSKVLSLELLYLIIQTTPSLQRFHIYSFFPAVWRGRDQSGRTIWKAGYISEGHLREHLPLLRQLLINTPPINFHSAPLSALTEYVNKIFLGGWLRGPWKNGPLRLDLYWRPLKHAGEPLQITHLKEFLDSQRDTHEDLDISLVQVRAPPYALCDITFVLPLWDAWYDFDAHFDNAMLPKDKQILLPFLASS